LQEGFPIAMNTRLLPNPPRASSHEEASVLILGGGLAGTSLAVHLEEAGFDGRVVIVDARRDFSGEARWCSWSAMPAVMEPLVSRHYHRWNVRTEDGDVQAESQSAPYQHIFAPDFFAHFHERFAREGQTELLTGHGVSGVWPQHDGARVCTRDEAGRETNWRADWVFDARGAAHSRLRQLSRPGQIYWRQSFVGLVVEFPDAVFKADEMTMMDFRVPQEAGVRFVYILPFSNKRALVEFTSFAPDAVPFEELEEVLLRWIGTHLGTHFRTQSRESGDLPMATTPLSPVIAPRVGAIGLCGGAARAATGYAFGRIQRQGQWIAQMLTTGQDPLSDGALHQLTHPPKFAALDAVFLEALGRGPRFAAQCFLGMVGRMPADSLTRFLEEQSSLSDELRLIAALPKGAFIRSAARRIVAVASAPQIAKECGVEGAATIVPTQLREGSLR